MKKIVLLTVVAALLSSSCVYASELSKSGYLAIKGGVFQPNTDLGTTDTGLKNFKSATNYEISGGFKASPYFALDAGLGYYSTALKSGANGKVNVLDVTLNAIGIIPISSVDLFAGAGFGTYFATIKDSANDTTGSALGYQLLGGVDINITDSIAIGGEVKYSKAKPEFEMLGSSSKIKINVGGTTYNGVLKFRF